MPGLTRDRREGVFNDVFDVPIRIVDTAGFEGSSDMDDRKLGQRNLNKNLVNEMMKQTRNALLYSDLALFVIDSRDGITNNDIALYNWLTYKNLQVRSDKIKLKQKALIIQSGPTIEDLEIVQPFEPMKQEELIEKARLK